MADVLRIGNAQGFWGDDVDAPARLVSQAPELDYLTLDYLAEVTLSIMAIQRSRDPNMGYARDFPYVVKSLAPYWKEGHPVKVVANAGGLNPRACAQACIEALRDAGVTDKTVALVTSDDVLETLKAMAAAGEPFTNMDTGEPIQPIVDQLVTANAYFGARPVVEALEQGADIVITGRIADPCMALAPCVHHFGWSWDDLDPLAQGIVAGHILECGAQVTGGLATDWLDIPDPANIGFPITEVREDGSFIVTKPENTGGIVNEFTVKEQLLYEMGNPGDYMSPDVRVDLLNMSVTEVEKDRVELKGAKGSPPPADFKVSATYRDGYRASGQLTIFGRNAVEKAKRSGQIILDRLKRAGYEYDQSNIECLGANACAPGVLEQADILETVLRISVADQDKDAVERFSKEIAPLVCSGAQGTTGYAGGRPRVQPIFGFWPCLISAERVRPVVEIVEASS